MYIYFDFIIRYTSNTYTQEDNTLSFQPPPHYNSYGLVGSGRLTEEVIATLYQKSLEIARRCTKKGGYIYVKCQNQVGIHRTWQIQQWVDELKTLQYVSIIQIKYVYMFIYKLINNKN